MHRVYVTLFLDLYVIFEMVVTVSTSIKSTNTHTIDATHSDEIWKSSTRSLMLSKLLSSSEDLDVERWLIEQNSLGDTSVSISGDISQIPSSKLRRLALVDSTVTDTFLGRQSGIYKGILQRRVHNDILQISNKRGDSRDSTFVKIKRNLSNKKEYSKLSSTAETQSWRTTRPFHEFGVGESGVGHRRLVKRDSSLLTEFCGPLGDRCQYVGESECVTICINGRRRTLCKVRNTSRNIVCLVL